MYSTRRGRKLSSEHKHKISVRLFGRKYPNRGAGKKLSEEHKRKISVAHLGKVNSPETREKIRRKLVGRKMCEPTRLALLKANIGGNKGSFKKGQTSWNKGKSIPTIQNEKNYLWKGDNVSYFGLHAWVSRKLGKPNRCEHCKSTNKRVYHWANISREYKRDLTDWIRLCPKCHVKYDREHATSAGVHAPSIQRINRAQQC